MICTLANSLWLSGCLPELTRFRRALRHVAAEQQALLQRLLAKNAETVFGRLHGFSTIRSVRDYQQRVPMRDYDEYQQWIGEAASGSPDILTHDPVRLFEPTSGSSGTAKLVPYTESLQREFQRGIRPWIADLFLHQPELLGGQAYWSVSPAAARQARTPAGIPIGFDDDAAYVAGWQQRLVQTVMAVPGEIRKISQMEAFRYLTLLFLLRSPELRLISVWNPTFLSLLADRLPLWGDQLAIDLERGTVNDVFAAPVGRRSRLQADPRRAAQVRAALRMRSAAEQHAALWPHLRLISCWSDANAAAPAAHLAALFPQAKTQGKGLISTEAFISFPLLGHEGAALAVRSHFLEFVPLGSEEANSTEAPQLAHQLDQGGRYSVVVTTGGGLYRYRLHDAVEVVGRVHDCPLIRFLGRQNYVSDWFGEKLNERHVAGVLRAGFDCLGISPAFAMLACDTSLSPAGYVLYMETPPGCKVPNEALGTAAAQIEAGLRTNFHYDYARILGQLAPLRIFRAEHACDRYLQVAMENGQRVGNVKPPALDHRNGWSSIFCGHFVPVPPTVAPLKSS